MKEVISIVPAVKDFEELKTIIRNGKRDVMCANLGTFMSASSKDKEISDKSFKMLPKIAIWKANWETLQAGLAPAVAELREEEAEVICEDVAKLTREQKQKIAQKLAELLAAEEPAA